MIAKESEERYKTVIEYGTDNVHVLAMRGKTSDMDIEVLLPTFLDRLFGATMEKRVHKAAQDVQAHCDELNEKLEEIDAVCKAAELPTISPRI